jgi:hypothetical protein
MLALVLLAIILVVFGVIFYRITQAPKALHIAPKLGRTTEEKLKKRDP